MSYGFAGDLWIGPMPEGELAVPLTTPEPPPATLADDTARFLAKSSCRRCLGRGKVVVAPVGRPETREVCRCVIRRLKPHG